MQTVLVNNFLPPLPAGFRWQVKHKRSWAFLTLQRHGWFGWKTLYKSSLNPAGMGVQSALESAAKDILYTASIKVNVG